MANQLDIFGNALSHEYTRMSANEERLAKIRELNDEMLSNEYLGHAYECRESDAFRNYFGNWKAFIEVMDLIHTAEMENEEHSAGTVMYKNVKCEFIISYSDIPHNHVLVNDPTMKNHCKRTLELRFADYEMERKYAKK